MIIPRPRSRSSSPEFNPLAVDEDVVPLPTYKAASTTSIDFSNLLSPPLKLREDLASGCGGQLWPAGMVLATHLLRHCGDSLKDARILELGAGGGLVGLAIALSSKLSSPVYITDQENMLPLMQKNIALNDLKSRVIPHVLDWGHPLPALTISNPPTHILAADCVYYEPAFPLLLHTLTALLEVSPEATIYFCFKKRRRADVLFMKSLKKVFEVENVADADKPVWERQGVFLYTMRRKVSFAWLR